MAGIPFSSCLQSCQHQDLFQRVGSSHQVAKVSELQFQHQSFQWILRTDFLYNWLFWFPCSQGLSRVFSSTTVQKHQFFGAWAFVMVQLSHPYTTTGKTIALSIWTFVDKVMSLLFNTLSRFIIAFLPRSMCLWISWLQSPSTVILEPKKLKSVTVSIFSPIYLPWSYGTRCLELSFLNVEF